MKSVEGGVDENVVQKRGGGAEQQMQEQAARVNMEDENGNLMKSVVEDVAADAVEKHGGGGGGDGHGKKKTKSVVEGLVDMEAWGMSHGGKDEQAGYGSWWLMELDGAAKAKKKTEKNGNNRNGNGSGVNGDSHRLLEEETDDNLMKSVVEGVAADAVEKHGGGGGNKKRVEKKAVGEMSMNAIGGLAAGKRVEAGFEGMWGFELDIDAEAEKKSHNKGKK